MLNVGVFGDWIESVMSQKVIRSNDKNNVRFGLDRFASIKKIRSDPI